MSIKSRALGLCLIAVAVSGVAAAIVSAETGGHLTAEVSHVILSGNDVAASDSTFESAGPDSESDAPIPITREQ